MKYTFPSRFDYFFFSEKLKEAQIEANTRRAKAKFEDAKLLQECLDKNRGIPAKFRIRNELADMNYRTGTAG
ncbi:MAG: hypothetical protein QME12_08420 [Nanoarchaeota archaeon]|nr:hypothetical protein [Nanoarchaeota archaeon]